MSRVVSHRSGRILFVLTLLGVVATFGFVARALTSARLDSRASAPAAENISAWILQVMPDTTVDVFVDGRIVASDLSYGDEASIATWTQSVGRRLEIRNRDDGATLLVSSLDALTSGDYSLVVSTPPSGVGGPQLTVFPNDIPDPPTESDGWLSVRNVDVESADLLVNGEVVTTEIASARGVLVPASGWVHVSVIVDRTEVSLGRVQVSPGRASIAYLFRADVGATVWQTLLSASLREALSDKSCAGHRISVDLNAGHVPTDGSDVILGTDGDDSIMAGSGDDIVCGGDGADFVRGQDGNDTILGEGGADRLRGSSDSDHLDGGAGADDLDGGPGDDVVLGGTGNDVLVRGGTGDDFVDGGPGDDVRVNGNGGRDVVTGGSGDDAYVAGGPRPDQIYGGPGDDVIKGLGGADIIFGDTGNDQLFGGKHSDRLFGGLGNDLCSGGTGSFDLIDCSNGPEVPDEPVSGVYLPCDRPHPIEELAEVICGELAVPVSYTEPERKEKVSVGFRRATRGRGAVPLLVLDGDLEAVTAPFAGGLLDLVTNSDEPFDLIMVDLRGTGVAQPSLDCPEVDAVVVPAKVVSYRAARNSIVAAEAECARRLAEQGIRFGDFNATTSAHDLERVRNEFGIAQWNIWAVGPGTLPAQALARINPDAIGQVVLQSAMGFPDDFLGGGVMNSERALVDIEETCAADPVCSATYPTLAADRMRLFAELSQTRPQTSATVGDITYPVLVDGDRFMRETLVGILQNPSDGPVSVPEAIAVALNELGPIVESAESSPTLATVRSEGALLASMCQDQYLLSVSNKERCAPWVTAGQVWSDPTDFEWPVPTLILSGRFDPVTPSSWGTRLAASSDLATDVVFPDAGTGLVTTPCAQDLVRAHLAGEPLDASCRLDGAVFGR